MSAAGTWNMTIDTPIGKQHATLVLTENADGSWAGTSRSTESGEEGPLEDLAVAGAAFAVLGSREPVSDDVAPETGRAEAA
jgi:hypothetical protein